VEQLAAKHPKLAECTAMGLPNERWNETVTVFVVPNTGASIEEQESIAYCREGLDGYKAPKLAIMLDEIPKNPSGAIRCRSI
jgi:fatty-acyl-CoA synthase